MRDPNRIPEVLAEVEKLWRRHPDWRLGQLLANVIGHHVDPFYIEDDVLLERVRAKLAG